MLPPKERKCHHTGFSKSCRALVSSEACNRWKQLLGKHPQTGEDLSLWDCQENHAFLLQIEANKLTREAGAATESFRNAVVGPRIPPPKHIEAIEHKEAAE